jgi:Leucine-rich repeat (LRR) protein
MYSFKLLTAIIPFIVDSVRLGTRPGVVPKLDIDSHIDADADVDTLSGGAADAEVEIKASAETFFDLPHGTTDAQLCAFVARNPQTRHLNIDGFRGSAEGLAHLQQLDRLQSLSIPDSELTDAHLEPLSRLTGLKELRLSGNPLITDAGLVHLGHLINLRALDLNGTRVTDAGLGQLSGLLDLAYLHLNARR